MLCIIVFLSDFYLYGVSEGDIVFFVNDDGSFGEILILIFFLYFDWNYDFLFVSKY